MRDCIMRLFSVLILISCFYACSAKRLRTPPLGPYWHAAAYGSRRSGRADVASGRGRDLISQCKKEYRNTTLDHFSWADPPEHRTTYRQRYYVCDKHWRGAGQPGSKGPIFFYVGNEADVTLYLNASGLMWESAEDFGALLVFAEHRYYGESKPYHKTLRQHMQFLTSEQAMADYAELLTELKQELGAQDSAVIGFGGSYGGMLGTWMRLKYPHILDGMVAGSAPIWTYFGERPKYDPGSYAKIVTRDASPEGGSAPACVPNARRAWQAMLGGANRHESRRALTRGLRICPHAALNTSADVAAFMDWASSAWDYLAMGDYPFPSTYILNGVGELPAFPVRAACEALRDPNLEGEALLGAMADAIGVFYNYTQDLDCYDWSAGANEETDEDADFWGYQWCTEQFQAFSRDGVHDMYWDQPFDLDASIKGCQEQWGVTPRPYWAQVEWGGRRIETGSNIVFSNGLLDPWSGGGVLQNISDSLVAVVIPEGAHHLDLMFSDPRDPPSVRAARDTQRALMRRWIDEVAARTESGPGPALPRPAGGGGGASISTV